MSGVQPGSPLALIWRARYWLVGAAAIAAIATYVLRSQAQSVYEAKAAVRLTSARQQQGELLTPDQQQTLTNVYQRIATTDTVVRRAWRLSPIYPTADAFGQHVTVDTENEVGVLQFVGDTDQPAKAAGLANAYARAFVDYVGARQSKSQATALEQLQARIDAVEKRLNK